jgi:hypothetical protein
VILYDSDINHIYGVDSLRQRAHNLELASQTAETERTDKISPASATEDGGVDPTATTTTAPTRSTSSRSRKIGKSLGPTPIPKKQTFKNRPILVFRKRGMAIKVFFFKQVSNPLCVV